MRTRHALHTLQQFPIYSAAFVAEDVLAVGGGGGSSRSGIKNKLRLYKIKSDTDLELLHELELEKDEDAPMSMAADLTGRRLVCGINSPTEQLEKGINENCRAFSTENNKLVLSSTARTLHTSSDALEDYQKVTAISPDGGFAVAAGSKDLAVLTYPSLKPAAPFIQTDSEIYDASFSSRVLVVATTKNVLVYTTPADSHAKTNGHGSNVTNTGTTSKKKRHRGKSSAARSTATAELRLLKTILLPLLPGVRGGTSSFRSARFHPGNDNICYTAANHTPNRVKGFSKAVTKRAFLTKWDAETWEPIKTREVGKKGITCFDISSNGKWLAYGSADLSISVLDANTLAPLLTILKSHDFPPTVVRFSPNSDILISGSADCSLRVVALPANLGSSSISRSTMLIIALLVLLLSILFSLYSQGFLISS